MRTGCRWLPLWTGRSLLPTLASLYPCMDIISSICSPAPGFLPDPSNITYIPGCSDYYSCSRILNRLHCPHDLFSNLSLALKPFLKFSHTAPTISLGSCTMSLIVCSWASFYLIGFCPCCPNATYQLALSSDDIPFIREGKPFLMLITANIYRALPICEALATYIIFIIPLQHPSFTFSYSFLHLP